MSEAGKSPKQSFEERVAAYKQQLRNSSARGVIELAATTPGGAMDFPSFPIDPALNAAANQLVNEAGLQNLRSILIRTGQL